jgi:6-phosphofructokinase 2
MAGIVTLTINPAIDTSTFVDRVVPTHKLRCHNVQRDPGGGGINVARVVQRLGGDVEAVYLAGGSLGQLLRKLMDEQQVRSRIVPIANETRESFSAFEESSGKQYRFVLPGPSVSESEWRANLELLDSMLVQSHYLVASGTLPPGVPEDFYVQVARLAKERGAKFVIDASGAPLRAALSEGVYMVKPNLNELAGLMGRRPETKADWIEGSRHFITAANAEVVALTLGHEGALLVTRDQMWRAPALSVKSQSAVGAGDSFLGAMIWSLAAGHGMEEALRYGVAAGSAALLTPGTELCYPDDVKRLHPQVVIRPA